VNKKDISKNQQPDKEEALLQDIGACNETSTVNNDSADANESGNETVVGTGGGESKLASDGRKVKKSNANHTTGASHEVPKEKKSSKMSAISYKTKEGIKQAAMIMADVLKRAYSQCYGSIKDKSLIDIAKKKKTITFTLLGFLAIIISLFILAFRGHHQKLNPKAASNMLRINNIQAELSHVQDTVTETRQMIEQKKQELEIKLQEIDEKLNEISKNSSISQSGQIKSLQATLQSNTVDLSQKIAALNKEINRIKTKVFPAPTLSAKALPFKVFSVDPWNGVPYAEVMQHNNSTMISYVGLYQTVGGWKVVDISASEQTVTFINARGQVVHVQVKQF